MEKASQQCTTRQQLNGWTPCDTCTKLVAVPRAEVELHQLQAVHDVDLQQSKLNREHAYRMDTARGSFSKMGISTVAHFLHAKLFSQGPSQDNRCPSAEHCVVTLAFRQTIILENTINSKR